MSNITPIHRPPVGVWPPCPPVPCPPPDCVPGMSGLERCYEEVKRAQAFLKQMLIDIIECDPSIIGRGTPIVGVTDGTDALPGMVGEYIQFTQSIPYSTTNAMMAFSLGSLPAGDWDYWMFINFSTFINDVQFNMAPLPAGFTTNLYASAVTEAGGYEGFTMASTIGRALTSVPSLIAVQVYINTVAAGAQSGTAMLTWAARRMR